MADRKPKASRQLTGGISNRGKSQRFQKLKKRDGPGCHYCKRIPEFYTIDEVIPRSRGGPARVPNQVLACTRCNGEKANQLLEEWTDRWYEQPGAFGP